MTKKNILFLFAFAILTLASAHSRTEVGFRFVEEGNKTYLEVHLTSATIFDLLYDLHPELKSKASLNLRQYSPEYESYFNDKIDIVLNDQEQSLLFYAANLITHDASVKFLIEGFEEEIKSYTIEVNGFDFYQKPSFTILVATASLLKVHHLTKENNSCAVVMPSHSAETGWIQSSIHWSVVVILFVGFLIALVVQFKSSAL